MVVWKYPLEIVGRQTIHIPAVSEIRHIGLQGDQVCLWIEVDPEVQTYPLDVFMFGTGEEFLYPDSLVNPLKFIGTVVLPNSEVYHFYRRIG